MASADFSQFVVITANETACETSRDKPVSLSSSTCLIYACGLRLPFGFHCFVPACPPQTPYYQVSVRQATISLSLLLAYISRCKPWESLWGSSATTPHVDFHHRLAACPPYTKRSRNYAPASRRTLFFTDTRSPGRTHPAPDNFGSPHREASARIPAAESLPSCTDTLLRSHPGSTKAASPRPPWT